jgi:hypothetical protein
MIFISASPELVDADREAAREFVLARAREVHVARMH